jgi:hypothetical protein
MAISSIKTGSSFTNLVKYNDFLGPNLPYIPTNFDSIATTTVGSGGASSISFTSIPSTYTHLQIRILGRTNRAAISDALKVQFNSDTTSNYSEHDLYADGGTLSTAANASSSGYIYRLTGSSATASVFGAIVVDIIDYANTNKVKVLKAIGGYDSNGSGEIYFTSNGWYSTSAITRIDLTPLGTSINQYSSFALYGIK